MHSEEPPNENAIADETNQLIYGHLNSTFMVTLAKLVKPPMTISTKDAHPVPKAKRRKIALPKAKQGKGNPAVLTSTPVENKLNAKRKLNDTKKANSSKKNVKNLRARNRNKKIKGNT